MTGRARDLTQLTRLPLSAAVSLSALAGHCLHPAAGKGAFAATLGVLLLAAGSTALNQLQERRTDALMERTRNRPLPAGRMRPATALFLAVALTLAGAGALSLTGSAAATALGAFSVLWYNGVYTPLKKRTPFALLPGALCGALPPTIGWTAAGGSAGDPRIVLLATLFFLWQIPHFWRLALRWRDDYRRAGVPIVCDLFSERQNRRILAAWIGSLAAGAFALLLFTFPGEPVRWLGGAALLALCLGAGREIGRRAFSLPRLALQADLFIPAFTLSLLAGRML